ncbi:hypothetical protein PInf_004590 [Phytophthora infestans]|nr:hypothetical protein PInf_004590 [Phytophthora infestans]
MVKLFCAVVGEQGSAFSVKIDASESVDDLRNMIRDHPQFGHPNSKMELFLAKKGGAWLTENEVKGVSDTSGLKHLDAARAKLRRVGLSEEKMVEVDEDDEAAGNGLVNVLVVVPSDDVVVPVSVPVAVPTGPEVDLRSCDHLLAFLESEMKNKAAIVSRPHILAQESLEFRLVGREQAIETASKCFKNIITHASRTASDRIKVAMPVCSGISGLGKTRMLEEGGTILERMKLNPNHVARVIVPYFNGFSPQSVERSMPIEASFSWRLLYRFFLDMNCDREFDEWFELRLPRNGAQLKLKRAVRVIERKLRDKLQEPATLYLYLGVDEYQKIEKIGAQRKDPNTSLLRELVEAIGALLCLKSSSLVLLPMFAGTDLGVIESSSIANSSYYVTERLPMYLLSMDQVFSIVESNSSYAGLLSHAQICRDLFVLGGVPRWVVEYLTAVKNTCVQGEPVNLDNINKCFVAVWTNSSDWQLLLCPDKRLIHMTRFMGN